MPTLQEVTTKMSDAGAVVPGKRVRFDFGSDGSILLDGVANRVSNDAGDVDTTVKLSFDNFIALANGKLNSTMAFMMGKLKLEGDMSVALQLQEVTAKMKP